ncbi:C40 family peptidase [Salinicola acroporae]|uniref:Peptidase n=1 Tax=Salinicola acroporae TaxID=1541440 RepID=A0ABT6IAK9_9GAMM|nr:C40 family peptidase [Salinicola acroporae]MDH4574275.1 peptidase [Salinicola acroporae]
MTCVAVAVAGLWTSPEAPRAIDAPALGNPALLERWLSRLDDETRLALCKEKRLATQVLLDTPVEILERHRDGHGNDWCRVVVPSQRSSLDERGYPGWIPATQLVEAAGCPADAESVVVIAPIAWLQGLPQGRSLKLSFLTRLKLAEPVTDVADRRASRVWVETSLGRGWLPRDGAQLPGEGLPATAATLETLGRRFDGLRYLWAGNSSFGYDCSGLVHSLFAAIGITLPRDAHDQVETGHPIELNERQAGDLLFFEKPNDAGRLVVDHVALYLGDDRMLHAPTNNARIECRRLLGSRYETQLCAVRRYLDLGDPGTAIPAGTIPAGT